MLSPSRSGPSHSRRRSPEKGLVLHLRHASCVVKRRKQAWVGGVRSTSIHSGELPWRWAIGRYGRFCGLLAFPSRSWSYCTCSPAAAVARIRTKSDGTESGATTLSQPQVSGCRADAASVTLAAFFARLCYLRLSVKL